MSFRKPLHTGLFLLACLLSNISISGEQIDENRPETYTFDRCEIRIGNLQGGNFITSFGSPAVTGTYTNKAWNSFGDDDLTRFLPTFFCLEGTKNADIEQALNARKLNGQWTSLKASASGLFNRRLKDFYLSGTNWKASGYLYRDDDFTDGRPFLILNVCIKENHENQAFCVNGPVEALDRPNESLLPILTPVLESVEFVRSPRRKP